MYDNIIRKKIVFIINIIYILILLLIAYFLFKYAFALILPFIIAFIISMLLEPSVVFFGKKLKIKRKLCVILTLIVTLLILVLLITLLSVTVLDGIKTLYSNAPEYKEQILSFLKNEGVKDDNKIYAGIVNFLYTNIKKLDIIKLLSGSFGKTLINMMSNIVVSIPNILVSIVITLVSTMFISLSFPEIKNFILKQLPMKSKEIIYETKRNAIITVKKYLKSYVTLMLITFIELTILFMIFKIQPSASIAFIISFVDALPVFGVGVVMIPWAIFLFISGNTQKAIVILSIYFVVAVIRQIIEPRIIGNNIGLHPLLTLISFYVGLKLFGIVGIIVIPVTLIILIDMHKRNYIKIWK